MRKSLVVICSILCFSGFAAKVRVVPSFNLGYTFRGGLHFGLELAVTSNMVDSWQGLQYGGSFAQSWTWVKTKKIDDGFHIIRQYKILLQNDFLDTRIGLGSIGNRWKERHICYTWGRFFELSWTDPGQPVLPWFGFKGQAHGYDWEFFRGGYWTVFSRMNFPTSKEAIDRIIKQ